jgi:hypothetical protein
MATIFDFETALKQLQSAQALTGENGIVAPLIKRWCFKKYSDVKQIRYER